jgi:S1-C subfamily serine protease
MTSLSRSLVLLLMGILIGTVAARSRLFRPQSSGAPSTHEVVGPLDAPLQPDESNTVEIFKATSPSVVFVTNVAVAYEDPLSLRATEFLQGAGTGFIWDEDGHIVTNYHVARGAQRLQVRLSDGTYWDAEVVGVEPDKDIAVLRIDAPRKDLRPVSVGTSRTLQVGQKVIAIGNPFGFDQTLTTGVVSALGRQIQSAEERAIHDVVQTDAAINPGNSGGPLLDSHGQLIGMNTAIYSPSGSNAGIGFAVPSDTIKRIVPEIVRTGRYQRPGLGVNVATDSFARGMGVPEGVMVVRVSPGSPGHRAGLRPCEVNAQRRVTKIGDVIIKVDEHRTPTREDLLYALEQHEIGDEVVLTCLRDDEEVQLKAKLEALGDINQ